MKALKIIVSGESFLLPESHSAYKFPEYIIEHLDTIKQYIEAGKKLELEPLKDHFGELKNLQEFIDVTGIIGFPLSVHDPDLYALENGIDVVMEYPLHGNVGNDNAKKEELIEYETIHVKVPKPLKSLAINHLRDNGHKNLSQYIAYLIKKDID